MKKSFYFLFLNLLFTTGAMAQQNTGDDPIGASFFSPELIMQHQGAIHLSEAQQETIHKELSGAQADFMTLQWGLSKEMEKLKGLIQIENPSENDVLEQLDRVLAAENKIKRRQITLLVRLKNTLTHEQREKLLKIKNNS